VILKYGFFLGCFGVLGILLCFCFFLEFFGVLLVSLILFVGALGISLFGLFLCAFDALVLAALRRVCALLIRAFF
jgi:hypothetical protein